MKKLNGTKWVALALMLVLSVFALTGCGGGGDKQTSGTGFDKNLIYKATYYDKPGGMNYIGNIRVGLDDKIYAQGYDEKQQKEVIVRINPDNGEVEKTIAGEQPKEGDNSYIMNFIVDEEGNYLCFLNTYVWDEKNPEKSETTYSLQKTDADGKEISRQKLEIKSENYFYPERILLDKDGNLIVSAYSGFYGYSPEGKQIFAIEGDIYVSDMVMAGDGTIYAITMSDDYESRIINKLDAKTGQLEEIRKMAAGTSMNLIAGKDGIYMNDGINMYSYDIAKDEKTPIVNWINSDVNGSATSSLCSLSDGRFAGSSYDDLSQSNQLVVMEKLPPEEVKDKKLVSLAMPYSYYNLNAAVVAFNRQNDEYRITVEDYAQYATPENYNAGEEKMNTDLVAGKVPDLIVVGNLPLGNYANKGLLADIYEKMDADSDFNRSDYLENIFKAYEIDGKLYSVVPSFSVQTVSAKEKNVGKTTGWTMEDLEKLMAKMPEGTKIFDGQSREGILNQAMYLTIEQYMDYEKGSCSFDSEDFIKLLNFASQFPAQEDGSAMEKEVIVSNAMEEEEGSRYAQDKVILCNAYLYSYSQIHDEKFYTYGGKDITYIGFPTANKQGSAINGNMEIAMSAKASHPDGAWAFIKYLLGDSYQETRNYEWPVKKSMYPKLKEKAQKPDTYIDENGKEQVYENTIMIGGKEVKVGKVTDEEVAKVDELLNSVTQVMRYDTKVSEIVEEESSAFFSGQKSAEEAAKLIQNRVQTYLSESR